MLKYTLSAAIFLSACGSSLQASEGYSNFGAQTDNYRFFDFFSSKPSTSDLQKEILALREKIEKLEEQQRELLVSINSAKTDFASNRDEHRKRIEDIDGFQRIIIRYGNNPDGMSALHYAIKMGDITAVNTLIENGADVNSSELVFRQQTVFTALMRAAYCNQLEIARLLINLGADVNLTPFEDCYYPIHYAAEYGSGDLITLLIENGAVLNKICPQHDQNNAKTPLHSACKVGNYEAAIALVNGGAKIDGNISPHVSVNHWKDGTPLDWAANSLTYKDNPQNLELIKFLVENGARRRAPNSKVNCSVITGYLQSVGR